MSDVPYPKDVSSTRAANGGAHPSLTPAPSNMNPSSTRAVGVGGAMLPMTVPSGHVCDSGLLSREECPACRQEERLKQGMTSAKRLPLPPIMTANPTHTESESDGATSEHSRRSLSATIGGGLVSPNTLHSIGQAVITPSNMGGANATFPVSTMPSAPSCSNALSSRRNSAEESEGGGRSGMPMLNSPPSSQQHGSGDIASNTNESVDGITRSNTTAAHSHTSTTTHADDSLSSHTSSSSPVPIADTLYVPPSGIAWWPEPPLITDFRRNAKFLAACYSICSYAVSTRRLCGVIVFSTAMYFIHRFVYCHGTEVSGRWAAVARIDAATLSAAAIFLASKAENFKVKLSNIIEIIFECMSTDIDRHAAYKVMTLQVEVMLLSTLSGSLTIIHPFATLTSIASETSIVGQKANKLYSYTVMTPLALYYDHRQIAMSLIAIVLDSTPSSEGGAAADGTTTAAAATTTKTAANSTKLASSSRGPPPPLDSSASPSEYYRYHLEKLSLEAKCATELALIEALVVKGKGCGFLPRLDAIVEQRLARAKEASTSRRGSVAVVVGGGGGGGRGGKGQQKLQPTPPSTPVPNHRSPL